MTAQTYPPDMLRPSTAAATHDMSRRQFDRLAREPDFPKPIRLGSRLVLFKRDELAAYFDRKRAENLEVAHG